MMTSQNTSHSFIKRAIRALVPFAGMLLVCGFWFPVLVVHPVLPAFALACLCGAAGMTAVVYGVGGSR